MVVEEVEEGGEDEDQTVHSTDGTVEGVVPLEGCKSLPGTVEGASGVRPHVDRFVVTEQRGRAGASETGRRWTISAGEQFVRRHPFGTVCCATGLPHVAT